MKRIVRNNPSVILPFNARASKGKHCLSRMRWKPFFAKDEELEITGDKNDKTMRWKEERKTKGDIRIVIRIVIRIIEASSSGTTHLLYYPFSLLKSNSYLIFFNFTANRKEVEMPAIPCEYWVRGHFLPHQKLAGWGLPFIWHLHEEVSLTLWF